MWFAQDTQFMRPRVNMRCRFWSREVCAGLLFVRSRSGCSQILSSPRNQVLLGLYTALVNDQLQEFADQPAVAGFGFVLEGDTTGLRFSVSGYTGGGGGASSGGGSSGGGDSENEAPLLRFARHLAQALQAPGFAPTEHRFAAIKAEQAEQLGNLRFRSAHRQASDLASQLLEQPSMHFAVLGRILADVNLDDVLAFHSALFADTALECLVHGTVVRLLLWNSRLIDALCVAQHTGSAQPGDAVQLVRAVSNAVSFRAASIAWSSAGGAANRQVHLPCCAVICSSCRSLCCRLRGLGLVSDRVSRLSKAYTVSSQSSNPVRRRRCA